MESIKELQEQFQKYVDAQKFLSRPQELYAPFDYILSLGGKRMRPILLLMSCNLFEDSIDACFAPAFAIELFHNFSLIHDDIMDKAPLRRGKASVHIKYNEDTAILSGDAMLVYAYQYLCLIKPELLPSVIDIFNKTAIGVCEGQHFDMNFENTLEITIPEYIRMIELKTAVLLHGAMKIGALIGGASNEQADLAGEFGRNMGIAFQLQDDYLDTFGDPEKFGKRVGGDIVQNKKTYLVLRALELADESSRKELLQLMADEVEESEEEAKIATIRKIFERLNIPQEVQKQMENYSNKAIQNLSDLDVLASRKKPLLDFLQYMMYRES